VIARARQADFLFRNHERAGGPCWACDIDGECGVIFVDDGVPFSVHGCCRKILQVMRRMYVLIARIVDPNRQMTFDQIGASITTAKWQLSQHCIQQRKLKSNKK
jgi:hypothetical protein